MERIHFSVNGIKCSVGSEVSSDVTLVDYLRNYLELRGTKYMCREGGCGACVVSVVKSPGAASTSVNACLVSVTSCHNWDITTIEKVGNQKDDYHPIQKSICKEFGTQCGYCTPGWVMSMYSLLKKKKNLIQLEIERSFASNVCRCTGYRPILDAFKKFAIDSDQRLALPDIEDIQLCHGTGGNCKQQCDDYEWCFVTEDDYCSDIKISLKDGRTWYRVCSLAEVFKIFFTKGTDSYMLVAGNTAKGAYPIDDYPSVLIDVSGVSELKGHKLDQNLIIGAGNTLTDLIEIFDIHSKEDYFNYLKAFYDHLQLVANVPVRNLGTIAGNLMIKHKHNEFPSDIFLLLETVGAELTIMSGSLIFNKRTVTMQDFLKTDMQGQVILNVLLPPLNNKEYKIVTYKIMPKVQNAHAIVNAGFLYKIINNTVSQARIAYSGLIKGYSRATTTEKYLLKKQLFTNETLQEAVKVLKNELVAEEIPPEPSAYYRKKLAVALFYKGLLSLCPGDKLNARYKSGATKIHEKRPLSKGEQIFDTKSEIYPLTEPLQKAEALAQSSGELIYTEDLPTLPREVFGAFVLSTEGSGTIGDINASAALKIPGVLAFYTAKDIPGLNSFTPKDYNLLSAYEEVFCSSEIKYFNEPIGFIVAETRYLAENAAKMVKVTYNNVKKPVIDVRIAKKYDDRLTEYFSKKATETGNESSQKIKGSVAIYHQYHFSMETLVCVVGPSSQGLKIYCSTQWMDGVQIMVAKALKMNINSIDVYAPQVGGAYGIKISRPNRLAVAAGLAAKNLNRPCRVIQPLTTNMRAVGKRLPALGEYEATINDEGVIQKLDYKLYVDNGYKVNETLYLLTIGVINNCYRSERWSIKGSNVVTDTHKNTFCRSPGTLEAIAFAEHIMEQISYAISVDPIKIRLAHLDTDKYKEVLELCQKLKGNSNYEERRKNVILFNQNNRWKKRGLRVAFMRWTPVGSTILDVNLSVYAKDGTVNITHSATEMGQGINTKAIQVASYLLQIPVEKIQIKENNTIAGPNAFITGGSVANQNVVLGVRRACEDLLERLKGVKDKMPNASWEEVIENAYKSNIDLQSHGFVDNSDALEYNCCGVCFAEVEVDILTGEHEIRRVDLIEDPGRSINPKIDIGQIEGAFVMGLGYWTSENIVFNPENGEILTDRTWSYYVPQALDIPQDFRIYLTSKYFSSDMIFGTKAIGEPGTCLAVAVPFAIREALVSARVESGYSSKKWFDMDGAYTLEKICTAAATNTEEYKFD